MYSRSEYISIKKLEKAVTSKVQRVRGRNCPQNRFQAAATVSGTLETSVLASGTGTVALGLASLSVDVEVEGTGTELLSVLAFFFFLSRPNAYMVSRTNTWP